jgi:outer membrane protein assembly factor BamA
VVVDVTARADSVALPANTPTLLDVTVTMKERWYWFVYPVFDLADRNFNEWFYDRGHDFRRTIYGLRLSNRNLTGHADRLGLVAQAGFTRLLSASYAWPYLDKAQTLGLSALVSYATNRDVAYASLGDKLAYLSIDGELRQRTYAGLTLTRRQGFYRFHALGVAISNNSVSDTVARLNPNYFGNGQTRQRYLQLGYSFSYDRRDNVVYPLRGVFAGASINQTGLWPDSGPRITDLGLTLTRYWPLSKPGAAQRFFVAGGLRAAVSLADRIPYYNLRGLGYGNDLVRGYELYVINGQQFLLSKNSLKFQLFNVRKYYRWVPLRQFNTVPIAAYLSLYADAGYVRSTGIEQYRSTLANRLLFGGGAGIDVVTFYNLVFRLNASVNREGQRGFFFNLSRDL